MRQLAHSPRLAWFVTLSFAALHAPSLAAAQQRDNPIVKQLESQPCVVLDSQGKVCKDDYTASGRHLEAISFRPAGEGRFPGVLLIPG